MLADWTTWGVSVGSNLRNTPFRCLWASLLGTRGGGLNPPPPSPGWMGGVHCSPETLDGAHAPDGLQQGANVVPVVKHVRRRQGTPAGPDATMQRWRQTIRFAAFGGRRRWGMLEPRRQQLPLPTTSNH